MTVKENEIGISSPLLMREVLEVFPGEQRALLRRHHVGGCRS